MTRCLLIGGTGYIGSRLFLHLRARGIDADTLDLEYFGNHVNPRNIRLDFRYASRELLADYDVVVLLAGHSSVGMASGSFSACFENNVVNFDRLMRRLRKGQKLIYASSASVYGDNDGIVTEKDIAYEPHTAYDVSKHVIDVVAPRYGIEYYGLRFGTVCGWSPLLRGDVIVNSMFLDAARERRVRVFNAAARRSILGLNDLCRAVERIIGDGRDHEGIYNIASFTASIGEIGAHVGRCMDAAVSEETGVATPYCFHLDTTKFERAFDFTFGDRLESILAELQAQPDVTVSHRREYLDYAPEP